MRNKQFSELMATLDSLEMVAGDVIDEVASIREEIKQTFQQVEQTADEIKQTAERRASA